MRTGRRAFLHSSTAAVLGAHLPLQAPVSTPHILDNGITIEATTPTLHLRYTRKDDLLQLFDTHQRLIVSTPLQPVIVVHPYPADSATPPTSTAVSSRQTINGNRIRFDYTLANPAGTLAFHLRITAGALFFEPPEFTTSQPLDIVSIHYFAELKDNRPAPALHSSFFVIPGISEGSSISPIQSDEVGLNETVWLGRGSSPAGLNQQWALPVHYFCGFSKHALGNGTRDLYTRGVSDSFACGLADLPNGDLFITLDHGRASLSIDYRSNLWQHARGPGTLKLGATLCLTIAAD